MNMASSVENVDSFINFKNWKPFKLEVFEDKIIIKTKSFLESAESILGEMSKYFKFIETYL